MTVWRKPCQTAAVVAILATGGNVAHHDHPASGSLAATETTDCSTPPPANATQTPDSFLLLAGRKVDL